MLPKQVRWQSELVMYDPGMPEIKESALETLPRAMDLAERGVVVAESMPELVRSERKAVFAAMHDEITRMLTKISEERTAILAAVDRHLERVMAMVSAERTAVLAGVHDETTRVLATVSAERAAVLEGVDRMVSAQWDRMQKDLPEVTRVTVMQTRETLEQVIDHTMMRIGILAPGE
jgi:hypothetical protein